MSIAKPLRILLQATVFVAVFLPSVTPSWWAMEKLWTTDHSSKQNTENPTFAVLVRQADHGDRYAVDFYPNLEERSKLVTAFDVEDFATINRDLRASISAESSHYVYFKVLKRGEGFTDVQLETPTTGDFWSKTSYRIQNGKVHLLRRMGFSPLFGITVAILPAFAGVLATLCCNKLLTKITQEPS